MGTFDVDFLNVLVDINNRNIFIMKSYNVQIKKTIKKTKLLCA